MSVGVDKQSLSLIIADISVDFATSDNSVLFNVSAPSKLFIQNSLTYIKSSYHAVVCRKPKCDFPNWPVVFKGEPWSQYDIDYKWYILQHHDEIGILVDFDCHSDYQSIFLSIHPIGRQIEIFIDSHLPIIHFDPFTYPTSVLAYVYLVHFNAGLMVHASGVVDGDKGYLFTGLSGIGKSTMAKLWLQKGATIINDDRLMIVPEKEGFVMHNTPMPYYADVPKKGSLSKIFLLKQAPQNYCRLLSLSSGYVGFMSNCIQHFHSHQMVKNHLNIIDQVSSVVPIYELGFLPNTDIVDLIRAIDN